MGICDKAGVKVQETAGVGVRVLLPLMEVPEVSSANLSLLVEEGLQQVYSPTISPKVNYKTFISSSKRAS